MIKEIDRVPAWKAGLATVQELAATRVLRITEGDHVAFADPRAIAAHLERRGCVTMLKRLDHGYPHPALRHPGHGSGVNDHHPHPSSSAHAGAAHGVEAQPDDAYFDVMASSVESHWWYEGRRLLLAQLLAGRLRPDAVALDVGCGTSESLDVLEAAGARVAVGTDLSAAALAHAIQRRPRPRVMRALAEHLPFADATFGALVSMDVIEHVDDDVVALEEYVRVCRPGAPVVLTVPAYEWLWSDHDDWAAHRRRYTAPQLRRAACDAGIVVDSLQLLLRLPAPSGRAVAPHAAAPPDRGHA